MQPSFKKVKGRAAGLNAGFDLEHSPAYDCLRDASLLHNDYRKTSLEELDLRPANSTIVANKMKGCIPGYMTARIDDDKVGLVKDGRGSSFILGPGLHCYRDPFYRLERVDKLTTRVIEFCDRAIVTVPQGFIGLAEECGQPLLLPPGLHQWKSATLKFVRVVDLTTAVIHIDPYTIVTVDEGYAAVTQDNGKMRILNGGSTYILSHRNWKFEMFISQKIQTDLLRGIKCASGDNVVIAVQATVNWRIIEVETAARMAADTMLQGGGRKLKTNKSSRLKENSDDVHVNDEGALDLGKLRNDVLKQAEASLSAFIALVNYSDTFGVSAAVTREVAACPGGEPVATAQVVEPAAKQTGQRPQPKTAALFDLGKLQSMVGHANEVTQSYGVQIISINIIQAFPNDEKLMQSLAKGAVAAAQAMQAETAARGKAIAHRIATATNAETNVMIARSEAKATEIRAKAAAAAAEIISGSSVAVQLELIERAGNMIGDRTAFFFGDTPSGVVARLAANQTERFEAVCTAAETETETETEVAAR